MEFTEIQKWQVIDELAAIAAKLESIEELFSTGYFSEKLDELGEHIAKLAGGYSAVVESQKVIADSFVKLAEQHNQLLAIVQSQLGQIPQPQVIAPATKKPTAARTPRKKA
jgi:hypothetical protein